MCPKRRQVIPLVLFLIVFLLIKLKYIYYWLYYNVYAQTLVDAQKSALKKLTTCLREAESQKTALMKDLEEERSKIKQESVPGDDRACCSEKERSQLCQVIKSQYIQERLLMGINLRLCFTKAFLLQITITHAIGARIGR